MKLIHIRTGKEAKAGDLVTKDDGQQGVIDSFSKPHKPSSEGKVYVDTNVRKQENYASVWGLKWIEREDRSYQLKPILSIENEVDRKLIAACDDSVKFRRYVELAIVRNLIGVLKDAFPNSVIGAKDDEDHAMVMGSEDYLIETLFSVNQSTLMVRNKGLIILVMGNDGWDVVSDYSIFLEPIMTPFLDWVEKQQNFES